MSDDDDFMMEEDEEFDFEYESGEEEEEGNVDLENKYYSAKGELFWSCDENCTTVKFQVKKKGKKVKNKANNKI